MSEIMMPWQQPEEDLYSTVADAVAKLVPDMQNKGKEPDPKCIFASAQATGPKPHENEVDANVRRERQERARHGAGKSDCGALKHSDECCWLWLSTDILLLHALIASAIRIQALARGRSTRRKAREGLGKPVRPLSFRLNSSRKGSTDLDSSLSEVLPLVH
jgi:hypothetical protein